MIQKSQAEAQALKVKLAAVEATLQYLVSHPSPPQHGLSPLKLLGLSAPYECNVWAVGKFFKMLRLVHS